MSAKNIIPYTAGAETLRNRAVLYEGKKERRAISRQLAARRKWRKLLADYAIEQIQPYPTLLQMRLEGIEPSRIVSGSPSDREATLKHLKYMKTHGKRGVLLMLTVHLKELDHLPLKSKALALAARELLAGKLRGLVGRSARRSAAVKRGGLHDGTHTHIVVAWDSVHPALQGVAKAAKAGKGGGGLFSAELHVCAVGDSDSDLEAVAAYLSRDGDEGLHHPNQDSADYLAALERKVSQTERAPCLLWHTPKLPRSQLVASSPGLLA